LTHAGPGKPQQYGRYSVQKEIASGAMASVFAARDPVLLRLVAIKVLHDMLSSRSVFVDRFFMEARTVAQLKSPNIVEVHDFGEEAGKQFLVMEFVDGLSLQGVLENLFPEKMEPVVAAALMCQAAEGLGAAARRGVVHRDIKPANLLISPQGYLKIADFGISHLKDHTQTGTGIIIGSACYMSPEQANGEKGITYQSDMFSLGTVFYRCLSGLDPFYTESVPGTLRKIVDGQHQPLHKVMPDLDPELFRLVETLLQKDPTKRGGGPSWLKTQLREYLLRKRVADPVERIRQFLSELSGRGVQTTGFISPIQIASAEVALANQVARSRQQKPRKDWKLKATSTAVVLLAIAAAGTWWRVSRQMPAPQPLPQAAQAHPVPLPATNPLSSSNQGPMALQSTAPNPIPLPPPARTKGKRDRDRRHLRLATGSGLSTRVLPEAGTAMPQEAFLTLNTAPPFCDVIVDGKTVGAAPLNRLPLSTGSHQIRLEAPQLNAFLDTVLNLAPGPVELKLKVSSSAPR
jgi:serine/threonine protein kinase